MNHSGQSESSNHPVTKEQVDMSLSSWCHLSHRLTGTVLLLIALATCVLGCGDNSPKQYDVSGTITFKDQPVPAGMIYFLPDGPPGYANIVDGKFDTREGGRGSLSGKVKVRIEGFEKGAGLKSYGKPLFMHEIEMDMPATASTQKFDAPASAAKNVVQSTGTGPGP